MTIIWKEFNEYNIVYASNGYKIQGSPNTFSKNSADIYLTFNGNSVGRLLFSKDSPLQKNMLDPPEYISLRYDLSLFGNVIDILRNEKPLWITLNTSDWNGSIRTKDKEPVGEAET